MSDGTPLDASYDRLLTMLANRGVEWLRQHVEALPDPLPWEHPAVPHLSTAAWIGEILSGLRGRISPLQVIVARRLSPAILTQATRQVAELGGAAPPEAIQSLFAAQALAADDPRYHLARQILISDAQCDLAERLAIEDQPADDLIREAEAFVATPMPQQAVTQAYLDQFALILMRLYGFGARRPRFSHPRVFGQIHANCLSHAEWAQKTRSLTATVQMAFCLLLIDPDHDISPMLAEVIPYQRPDGSFPPRSAYSTESQALHDGAWATLMTVAALHMATYRRWNASGTRAPCCPMRRCRDMASDLLVQRATPEGLADLPDAARLDVAASLSVATGEDWFTRTGLAGLAPRPDDILRVAPALFGSFTAARHARAALALSEVWSYPALAGAMGAPDAMGQSLNWLRGTAVTLDRAPDAAAMQAWDEAARRQDDVQFKDFCTRALTCLPATPTPAMRAQACRMMLRDLAVIEDAGEELVDQVRRLGRMNLLVSVFEPDAIQAPSV